MNDQPGFGSGSPSLSREMFDAIMRGEVPGSPRGPRSGAGMSPYAFGQATMPMGDMRQGLAFGAGPPTPGFARRRRPAPQRAALGQPNYAQPREMPMQARSARSMGAMPDEVTSLFAQGGWGGYGPYGYGGGDPRINGGAGGWDMRAGYGNPYAGSER